jgi:dTDP-4-dehydrorhamnose reductase
VRLALIYGWSANDARCFTETIVETLSRGAPVGLFDDEYRTPLSVANACEALLEIAERPEIGGILHLAGIERCSRFEFGRTLCDAFGLDRGLVEPVSVSSVTFRDLRPRDGSLDTARARETLRTELWDVATGLAAMASGRRP